MPVNVKTVLSTNIKTRWREPFASEALNQKSLGVVPPGAYRGLLLVTEGALDLTVTVTADPTTSDHVAVAETSNGYSLNYINAGGDFNLDLNYGPLLSMEVVITLQLTYTTGADTAGEFIAYTVAEFEALSTSARDALVVLGSVDVPAAGIIPAADVTGTRRSLPFERRSAGATPWTPLVRNGSFDVGDTAAGYARGILFWHRTEDSGDPPVYDWDYSTTDSVSAGQSLALTVNTFSTVFTAIMRHRLGAEVPEVPAGRQVRVAFQKKQLIVPTAGTVDIILLFKDAAGTTSETVVVSLDVTGTDASFVAVEKTISIPSGMVALDHARIKFDGTNFPSTGEAFLFDDFQIWLEPDPTGLLAEKSRQGAMVDANVVNIRGEDAEKPFSTALAQLDFNGANLTVRNPQTSVPVGIDIEGRGILGTGLLGNIANAEVPRILAAASVFAGVEFTIMWESVPSGQAGHRFFVGSDGSCVRTFNASYDNTANLWSQDKATADSFGVFEDAQGITSKRQIKGSGDWATAGWDIVRVVVDRTGYRSGRVTEIRAEWIDTADPPGWGSTTGGPASVSYAVDDSVFEGPSVKLLTTGGGGLAAISTDQRIVFPSSDKIWVLETEVYFTNVAGIAGSVGFLRVIGSTSGAYFAYNSSASGFWRAVTFDDANLATPNVVVTSVAPVANTPQRLRIEMYGSAIRGGARVLFYIDNVLVSTSTTKQPDNQMDIFINSSDDGAGVSRTFIIAPVTAYYNRVLRDDT